jgi:hypothetical protein
MFHYDHPHGRFGFLGIAASTAYKTATVSRSGFRLFLFC